MILDLTIQKTTIEALNGNNSSVDTLIGSAKKYAELPELYRKWMNLGTSKSSFAVSGDEKRDHRLLRELAANLAVLSQTERDTAMSLIDIPNEDYQNYLATALKRIKTGEYLNGVIFAEKLAMQDLDKATQGYILRATKLKDKNGELTFSSTGLVKAQIDAGEQAKK